MKNYIFAPADILLPKKDFEKWSVIACDQFTSRPDYWENVKAFSNAAYTTLDLIYPEVYLGKTDVAKVTEGIISKMNEYIANEAYNEYKNAFIYVERIQSDGKLRIGLVGAVDLDQYDYCEGSTSRIRATEKTVLERIPPRVQIRKDAPTELPHILILMDDVKKEILEPIKALADSGKMEKLYDFDLMLGGGHIKGYLVPSELNEHICEKVEALGALHGGITLAVGDGNHSLATAKACRELGRTALNKYALCELVNIHSEAIEFEPIYRTVENTAPEKLLADFKSYLIEKGCILESSHSPDTQDITYVYGDKKESLYIKNAPHALPVGTVQLFLDAAVKGTGAEVDYIHGEDEVCAVAQKANACGFIYGGMGKSELFDAVEKEGVLPRKTFSMGTARDKRYYTEARMVKELYAMKKVDLCGNDWSLIYVKNDIFKKDGVTADIDILKKRSYPEIPASVPGNLEIDLQNAGVIDDPFYADNHQKRDCEYLHMFYHRTFVYDGSLEDPELLFEGIDTVADIYLNGTLIGSTDNMLIPHKIDCSDALKVGKNTLTVHIKPAVIEARKYTHTLNDHAFIYNAESLYMRKAPHMYAWDIMPRLVSAGIWRPCSLTERKKDRIVDFYCYTQSCDPKASSAHLKMAYNTQISSDDSMEYEISIHGECGDSVFDISKKLWHTSGNAELHISNAKLWWPKFNGEQNLYDITVTLSRNGEQVDTYKTRIGLRTVALDRTSTTNEKGEGEFVFKVNGKKIFCMGTNWVPVDALHSRDRSRLPDILPMLNDINCNIIRTWGGNIYEDKYLYDFCDENGILIWQDFIMGCAIYPQEKDFRERLYAEAVAVIKMYRDHPSLLLYAGDNECDSSNGWFLMNCDPNDNILTRNVLKEAVRLHDYTRPYLPSSPYMDQAAFESNGKISEDHLWGPRDYFKGSFYKNTVCHFASETGYHGCNSPSSLKKFIPSEYLWTSKDSKKWSGIDNDMWIAHAASPDRTPVSPYTYRIRLMADQVTTLFGSSVPNTLDDFAKASQISQAEAKKYFIERFRVSKWRRTGIIWWNLIDGWPQISDAVVDYYYTKKLAYHYIKRSQEPICMMFDEPIGNVLPLHAVNEFSDDRILNYEVTDLTTGRKIVSGTAHAAANSSVCVYKMDIEPSEKHFYLIEWELDGKKYTNHYVTNIIDLDYNEYMGYIKKCGYDEFEGF